MHATRPHVPQRAPVGRLAAALAAVLAVGSAGCSAAGAQGQGPGSGAEGLRVVTTTQILADLVREIGGERVQVDSLVPPTGDPHSYEPTPADIGRVTEADVTFTNHLLLEEQALIRAVDANVAEGVPNVSLAEASETYGATVMPLVEDVGLDVLWLGLRVRGAGEERGATRTSEVRLTPTALDGPGELTLYLTGALGQPEVYWDSVDGFADDDVTTLPPEAHTHLNWAFSEPGEYRLTLSAGLDTAADGEVEPLGESTFAFAVGIDPNGVDPGADGVPIVLDDGHSDISVDLDTGELYMYGDPDGGMAQQELPADGVVIDVPNRAVEQVPDEPAFDFLGRPGAEIYQLPQAVLGKHVHGEIDPHLWQDVANAASYVQLMRDTLMETDPEHAAEYQERTAAFLTELDELDDYVRDTVATIPADRRQLVTTHDAFGYLANAYDMTVAGFVVPNPAQEPSVEQVDRLTTTIQNLDVPAVFMEPHLAARTGLLSQVAADNGAEVCKLYGDAFDDHVSRYTEMMRWNADELARCLGGAG